MGGGVARKIHSTNFQQTSGGRREREWGEGIKEEKQKIIKLFFFLNIHTYKKIYS